MDKENVYVSIDNIIKKFYSSDQKPNDYKKLWNELQTHHACRSSWFNREFLTIDEAILIYYGIDPDALIGYKEPILDESIAFWDFEKQLYPALKEYCSRLLRHRKAKLSTHRKKGISCISLVYISRN